MKGAATGFLHGGVEGLPDEDGRPDRRPPRYPRRVHPQPRGEGRPPCEGSRAAPAPARTWTTSSRSPWRCRRPRQRAAASAGREAGKGERGRPREAGGPAASEARAVGRSLSARPDAGARGVGPRPAEMTHARRSAHSELGEPPPRRFESRRSGPKTAPGGSGSGRGRASWPRAAGAALVPPAIGGAAVLGMRGRPPVRRHLVRAEPAHPGVEPRDRCRRSPPPRP